MGPISDRLAVVRRRIPWNIHAGVAMILTLYYYHDDFVFQPYEY